MRTIKLALGATILLAPHISRASSDSCDASEIKTLLDCVEQRSTESQIARSRLESAESAAGSVGVFPNPELEFEHSRANKHGGTETEASILFSVAPTKLFAESAQANARVDLAQAETALALSGLRSAVIAGFRKLYNTAKLLEIAKESQVTFAKVVKQYSSRPRLSAEQDASLGVFRMAEKESAAKVIELQRGFDTLTFELQQKYSVKIDLLKSSWTIKKWPTAPSKNASAENSPFVKEIRANKAIFEADYRRAKAESWPELKLGPLINISKDNTEEVRSLGFRLSLPLPLFNLNRGGRAAARKELLVAELHERRGLEALKFNEDLLRRVYAQSVDLLTKLPSDEALKKSHDRLERMFLQGIIPSSLMIDAHQELFDSQEIFSETEQQALDALFKLQIHNGVPVGQGLI